MHHLTIHEDEVDSVAVVYSPGIVVRTLVLCVMLRSGLCLDNLCESQVYRLVEV